MDSISFSRDFSGVYFTLKRLKEIKYGDKSTIVKVKTAMAVYFIDKTVNDDEAACSSYNIYFCDKEAKIEQFGQQVMVTYFCVDGKPVETSLLHLLREQRAC